MPNSLQTLGKDLYKGIGSALDWTRGGLTWKGKSLILVTNKTTGAATINNPAAWTFANNIVTSAAFTATGGGGLSAQSGPCNALQGFTQTVGTITTNTPALTFTPTWNSSGVAFQGIFGNVTPNAYAAGSRFLSLQNSSTEVFGVDPRGSLNLAGAIRQTNITAVSAGYTVNSGTVPDSMVVVTTGSSAITITLPTAAAGNAGQTVNICKGDSGIGTVVISGALQAVSALATQGQMYTFTSDGVTGWFNR